MIGSGKSRGEPERDCEFHAARQLTREMGSRQVSYACPAWLEAGGGMVRSVELSAVQEGQIATRVRGFRAALGEARFVAPVLDRRSMPLGRATRRARTQHA
jgi:hypothetical protein